MTHSDETSRKCLKINFQICWCLKCLNSKLQNDVSLVIVAQSFTHEKSIFLLKIPMFSIDLWHVYWPVSQKVFWQLTAGFVGVGHKCWWKIYPSISINYVTMRLWDMQQYNFMISHMTTNYLFLSCVHCSKYTQYFFLVFSVFFTCYSCLHDVL